MLSATTGPTSRHLAAAPPRRPSISASRPPKCRARSLAVASPTLRMPSAKMKRASVVSLALLDRVDHVRPPTSRPCARAPRASSDVERVEVGRRAHEPAVDQLVDQLVAQALDIHARAASEMQQRLLALRRADSPPVQRATASSSSRTTAEPHTGHCVGITNSRASARAPVGQRPAPLRESRRRRGARRPCRRCGRPCAAPRPRCAASRW